MQRRRVPCSVRSNFCARGMPPGHWLRCPGPRKARRQPSGKGARWWLCGGMLRPTSAWPQFRPGTSSLTMLAALEFSVRTAPLSSVGLFWRSCPRMLRNTSSRAWNTSWGMGPSPASNWQGWISSPLKIRIMRPPCSCVPHTTCATVNSSAPGTSAAPLRPMRATLAPTVRKHA